VTDPSVRLERLAITTQYDDLSVGGALGGRGGYVQASREAWVDNAWSVAGDYLCGSMSLGVLDAGGELVPPTRVSFHPARVGAATVHEWGSTSRNLYLADNLGTHAVLDLDIVSSAAVPTQVAVQLCVTFTPNSRTRHSKKPPFPQAERRSRVSARDGRILYAEHDRGPIPASAVSASMPWDTLTVSEPSRATARWQLEMLPGATTRLRVVLSAADGLSRHAELLDSDDLSVRSDRLVADDIDRVQVMTPDERIDLTNEWAKINTVRVQHAYPLGSAFTNDPPQDVAVVRDMAWYTMGGAYIDPVFTSAMLDLTADHAVEPDGSLAEFVRCSASAEAQVPPDFAAATFAGAAARSGAEFADFVAAGTLRGQVEGYDLAVKDDTPLFVLACAQQFRVDGDVDAVRRRLPTVVAALTSLLAQTRDDGLVWSASRVYGDPTNVWGLATWRNIINAYQLLGAVTEINCLCVAAYRAGATLTELVGGDGKPWLEAADALATAINTELWSAEQGIYAVAKTTSGLRTEITSDVVFSVLFGVAPPERAEAVAQLLSSSRVQHSAGARTIPAGEPEYDPEFGFGLMGGVWPNLTAWVAVALRELRPELVLESLRRISTPVLSTRPGELGQVAPGAFPEWFSGDDRRGIASLGMAASPWMPPTFTWCVVEGLLGIAIDDDVRVQPAVPNDWGWWGIRRLPSRRGEFSLITWGGQWIASHSISGRPTVLAQHDVTDQIEAAGSCIALASADTVYVLVRAHSAEPTLVRYGATTQTVVLEAGDAALLTFPRTADSD
jgi:hypothetical protein